MPFFKSGLLLLVVALTCAACTDRKQDAEQALARARQSLDGVRAEAAQHAPHELSRAEDQLADLDNRLAQEKYEAVLDGIPALKASIESAAGSSRKASSSGMALAVEQWNSLSTELPPLIGLAENRLDMAVKKARTSGERAALEAARADLSEVRSGWARANSAFGSGRPVEAVAEASEVKRRTHAVLRQLGISLG